MNNKEASTEIESLQSEESEYEVIEADNSELVVFDNNSKSKMKLFSFFKNEKLKRKLPFYTVTILLMISLWLSARAITNLILLLVGQFRDSIPVFILFGNPLQPTIFGLAITTIIPIITWLASTRVKVFQNIKIKTIMFFQMFVGIAAYYTWYITAPVYNSLVPYLQMRVSEITIDNVWHTVLMGNTDNLMILLVFIPLIITTLLLIWISSQYSRYSAQLKEAFVEYELETSFLQGFFNMGNEDNWPDVVLGPDIKSKQLIIQPGRDRTLNNIIVGSIGTGKTAALVLPILNQDLGWMTRFINDFPGLYKKKNFHSEEVKGMYLNGISVIEPSNDLCEKAFQLVKAHNIPEESVYYIDPTNPDTPSINPMQGPVDQVAEAFAMVIEGLAEGGANSNFFFQQSERNHLKHYIYLLKLHDPDKEVTFDMLLDMYNNSQFVRRMHVKLKDTIPESIDDIEDRDERNHWKIVQQIDEWFDLSLLPRVGHNGVPVKITTGDYRGDIEYYDARAEYVQGLRNILNDIGANKLIRRVLFGKSDFNFDKHLEFGGVLLVNSAKGELGGLSNVLGKLVLLSLQNAVFRREPNVSSFHHILVDEFPDYIYRPFKEFPAQSRKYKCIVTIVTQTITQLSDKYGETYMHTLLGTLRHKMVFGDVPSYDAKVFSEIFGEKDSFEEVQSEQSVSPLQENPMTRAGSSYTENKNSILSPSDIIFQKEFQAAVKIVRNNRPIPVHQIDANFVPKEQFEEALITIDTAAGKYWLNKKKEYINNENEFAEEFVVEAEEDTEFIDELSSSNDAADIEDNETMEAHKKHPRSNTKANYNVEEKMVKQEAAYHELNTNQSKVTLSNDQNSIETKEIESNVDVSNVSVDDTLVDDPLDSVFGNHQDNINHNAEDKSEGPTVSEISKEGKSLLNDIANEVKLESVSNEPQLYYGNNYHEQNKDQVNKTKINNQRDINNMTNSHDFDM